MLLHLPGAARAAPTEHTETSWHIAWFVAVSAVAFLVPHIFSSVLELQHDLYYLVYFVTVFAVLAAYVRASASDVAGFIRQRWRLSLVIGVLAGAFVVWSVLAKLESTPHPEGAYFGFEIVWRGAIYGFVDALLLSAFPGLVALNLLHGRLGGVRRRLQYAGLTLALVVIITAVYHAGFEELRTREGIMNPEIGNSVISLPVIVSANPAGSFIAHTSMHVAAVTHSYETENRIPPQTFVDEN